MEAILNQIDLHGKAVVVKALVDCAIRNQHQHCLWYINHKFGYGGVDTPDGLQRWFNENYP